MMQKVFFFLLVMFSALYSYTQNRITDTSVINYTDTLLYKTGVIVVVNVNSIDEYTIEYTLKTDKKVHYTSFYIIDQVKMGNGYIVKNKGESIAEQNIKKLLPPGPDSTKRNGHLIVNSYVSSLIRDNNNFNNNIISLGLMYYISNHISLGTAYQFGLKDLGYSRVHLDNIYDFNLGWSGSTIRKIDLGIRVGVQITNFSYIETLSEIVNIYKEELDQSIQEGYYYDGIYYNYFEKATRLESTFYERTINFPYIGIEANAKILPKFSISGLLSFRNGYPYTKHSIWHSDLISNFSEFYNSNQELVHRQIERNFSVHGSSRHMEVFFRLSLNYHFFAKSEKVHNI
tara:strand:- start:197 stop:1228 length:1032 start_codon:yes stop_codon:yes gene_type:complete